MNPTRAAIAAATATLSRAAIFDDRITADEHRILAWAQAIAPFSFDQPDLLAAVTAHYQQAEPRTMMPGDAIAGARKIREERRQQSRIIIEVWGRNFTTEGVCPACGEDAGSGFLLRINHGLAPWACPGAADFSRLRKCTRMGWRPVDITEDDRAAVRALRRHADEADH